MAVDSRTKRLSMLNFSIGALLPDPSGTIDVGGRLTLLDLYRGIVPSAGVDRTPVICPAADVLNLGAAAADVYTGLPVAADVLTRSGVEGDIA